MPNASLRPTYREVTASAAALSPILRRIYSDSTPVSDSLSAQPPRFTPHAERTDDRLGSTPPKSESSLNRKDSSAREKIPGSIQRFPARTYPGIPEITSWPSRARDQTLRSHLAELDTADAEQSDVALRTTRDLATVVLADGVRVAGQLREGDPRLLVIHLAALHGSSDLLALMRVTLSELGTLHLGPSSILCHSASVLLRF